MAEPARRQDIEPDIAPDLRSIPGGGQTTPGRANLTAVKNYEDAPDAPKGSADLNDDATPSNVIQGNWDDKTVSQDGKQKGKFFTRRKVGIIGGTGGIIGLVIFFISGFGSLGGLLINLGAQATSNLDSRSNILSNRLFNVIDRKMTDDVTSGSCDVIKIACRFSKPSNAFLTRLSEYGIEPTITNSDGTTRTIEKKTVGFPNERPTHYVFTDSRGNRISVPARDFVKTLRTNAEFRAVFTKAYNMRYWGYASSTIKKLFYRKYDVDRSGKQVNSIDPETPNETVKNLATDADKDNPVRAAGDGAAKNSAATEVLEEALENEVEQSARRVVKTGGDPILTIGTLACVTASVPSFVTNVVRLYQMRQLIAVAASLVLVSSDMIRAGDMQPETMGVIGGLLTATALLPNGTTTKSAMDSFGIKNVLFGDSSSISNSYKKFIPGGTVAADFGGINALANDPAFKETCAQVTSPQAQLAVTALEAGIGAGTAGTGAIVFAVLKALGKGLVTIGAADLIIRAAAEPISAIIKSIPPETVAALLANPDIENASGEDLGNVTGAGLRYFFSTATLATGGAPLTTTQVTAYSNLKKETDIAYAEQDRIGRSPFDISSSSTFLGSIAANYYQNAYVASSVGQTILSSLGYALRQPLSLFSNNSYAVADNMATQCNHAEEFGVDSSIAVGPFADICAGVPAEYLNTSTDVVLGSVSGMIDENTGAPLDDQDVAMTLSECGQGSLLNAQGCVIDSQERANLSLYLYDLEINTILDSDGVVSDAGGSSLDDTISFEQQPTTNYSDMVAQLFQSYQSVSVPVTQPSIPQTATSTILALGAERRAMKDQDTTTFEWIPVIG